MWGSIVIKYILGKTKAFLSSQAQLLDKVSDGRYASEKMRQLSSSLR